VSAEPDTGEREFMQQLDGLPTAILTWEEEIELIDHPHNGAI
jgi:hypothetical protein